MDPTTKAARAAVIGLALALAPTVARGGPNYGFTTLDVPGADPRYGTQAWGINNLGQVVGNYFSPGPGFDGFGPIHGFLFSGGVYTTLDAVGYQFDPSRLLDPVSGTKAYGINDAGQIALTGNTTEEGGHIASAEFTTRGFEKTGANYTILSPLGVDGSTAFGINNHGQVVGTYTPANSVTYHGLISSGGVYTTLDAPGATVGTTLSGINDAGQVVGSYDGGNAGSSGSFLYAGGLFTAIAVPGAIGTDAIGINDAGQIVGTYFDGTMVGHGFILSGGVYTTLDAPGATKSANLYESGTYATGINNLGQVVGYYADASGEFHGFVATPAAVPEPSSLALLGLAVPALTASTWRRRRRTRAASPPMATEPQEVVQPMG